MIILISFGVFLYEPLTTVGESTALGSGEASQAFFSISTSGRRKLDSSHGDKIHRSNASIAMRKRGFQSEDRTNENEGEKTESELTHSVSSVDYEWKGSRKKLLMQYFLVIWKELCEKECVLFTTKVEDKIRSDVLLYFSFKCIAWKSVTKR